MLQRLAGIKVKIDKKNNIYLLYFGISMWIRLVTLIFYVKRRWVGETGGLRLRAIGFLNQYNKVKLS